ncbi:O-acetyl-ADP-ribose deacetylase [Mycolicibacterium sp. P1-18]|nr:O-acetyl-ADP-ribose deacetylase [Mycolicibacterium sp. P1-18]
MGQAGLFRRLFSGQSQPPVDEQPAAPDVEPAVLVAVQANITKLSVDAIVNAANQSLLGGGGVDGAIHEAAGPELLKACRPLNGCEVGNAKITRGYRLQARYVIHAVGPVWHGGGRGERDLLASCYRRCLEIAAARDLATIAFPSISTGVFNYPIDLAAEVAVSTVRSAVKDLPGIRKVTFCCFSARDLQTYKKLLGARTS